MPPLPIWSSAMSEFSHPTVRLPSGERVPQLGQGTWGMGESVRMRKDEVAALRLGIDLGLTLIDTAEMYGDGVAEEIVAEAVEGRRDECFIVSKVLPENATRAGTIAACERSLRRLKADRIDLYLLHWSSTSGDTLMRFVAASRRASSRLQSVADCDQTMRHGRRLPFSNNSAFAQVFPPIVPGSPGGFVGPNTGGFVTISTSGHLG